MKKWIVFLIVPVLMGCGSHDRETRIQGQVSFEGSAPDTVYVGLYSVSTANYLGNPIRLMKVTNGSFELKAGPGMYTFAIFAHPFEPVRVQLAVVDQPEITIHATLPRLGLPESIQEVKVYGEFSQWQTQDAIPLKLRDGTWKMEESGRLTPGQEYVFWVDGKIVWNPAAPEQRPAVTLGRMHSVYQGGALVLDPSLFSRPGAKPEVNVEGIGAYASYETVAKEVDDFDSRVIAALQAGYSREQAGETFDRFSNNLDSMTAAHPAFEQLFLDKSMGYMVYLNPVFYTWRDLYAADKPDSAAEIQYLLGDEYGEFFDHSIRNLRRLNLNSPLVNGDFNTLNSVLESNARKVPRLLEAKRLKPDFFYKFYLQYAKQSPNADRAAGLLYNAAFTYSREQPDKAEALLDLLKTRFAQTEIVTGGYADKLLQDLKMKTGTAAPDFSVTTLEGETLRLSDFRGKFVMIDFWGSWCGPCRGETPNFIQLYKTVPREELQIIGLANDELGPLTDYIKEFQIPYPNALAPEEVLDAWGVSAYPTTYLVDPEGRILAKNLRGTELVTLVRQKMEEFRSRPSGR